MVFPVVVYGCESWTVKKAEHRRIDAFELWCWRRLLSPLVWKESQPVHSKGDQSWVFLGRTDAKAETPILWPPHAKSWLIWKDPDAGRDWGQEEKGTTEDEMAGWHHQLDGHEFFFFFFYSILIKKKIIHVFPILNPPPSSLPIPSLWVVPVHQPQASSIVHWTWTGISFHTWHFTCFNAILPNLPTLSLSHRVQKMVTITLYTRQQKRHGCIAHVCFISEWKWNKTWNFKIYWISLGYIFLEAQWLLTTSRGKKKSR